MTSKKEIEDLICQIASNKKRFGDAPQEPALSALLAEVNEKTFYPWLRPWRYFPLLISWLYTPQPGMAQFIPHYGRWAFSFKMKNFTISWSKLFIAVGAGTVQYMNGTLFALTLLGYLAKGFVHAFDEIDVRILKLIHENSDNLSLGTKAFYKKFSDCFPPEINEALFMQRLVELSRIGAISINDDRIRITEDLIQLDPQSLRAKLRL